jgi:hypothetical protein
LGQTRHKAPRLAKCFFHPDEPSLIVAVDAVRVDPADFIRGDLRDFWYPATGKSDPWLRDIWVDLGC